jgi:hypothetical protein
MSCRLIDLINKFPDKSRCNELVDWEYLSENPNITLRDILNNPDKPWNWYYIGGNPNITLKDMLDHSDKPWDWYFISQNPNITLQYILDNPNKSWDWYKLSYNTFGVDLQDIHSKRRVIARTTLYKNELFAYTCAR